MTFLVPLGIILLEHYFGILFSLDHVKDAYYEQMGIDPWQVDLPPSELIADVRPILNLTYTSQRPQCPAGLRRMINVHNPKSHSVTSRKIPMIVHQTSKSRCLTTHFDRATVRWAFRRWSYYFHDNDAVDRLLQSDFPEFPHLKLVVEHCLASRSAKLGLWRHLVLWVYGGVYADLNTYPAHFNATTLQDMDDGFFLTDPDSQMLSTELMAMSPRHPLMYYAIQHGIDNVLRMKTAGSTNPRELTAEGALHQAMEDFEKGTADTKKTAAASNSKRGIVQGFQGHSIRVAGSVGGPEEYITPIFITEAGKRKEFGKMGIESTNEPIAENCLHNIMKH
jgi:hypothetical protein